MRRVWIQITLLAVGMLAAFQSSAVAQVLIWSLPEQDGSWVRFEGTYRQTQAKPNAATGDLVLEWQQELTISSVGRKQAEYQGNQVPCRWVEFRSVSKPAGVEKEPGPGGVYIYKVLIPEESVIGKPVDDATVPVTFIPVIEGLRKVGDRDVEPVTESALAVYPHIAPLTYYPNLAQVSGQSDELAIAGNTVATQVYKGSRLLQDKRSRSKNSATLWLTDAVPFGLAKFSVAIERDSKLPTSPVEDFKRSAVIAVEMNAVETGTNARSLLSGAEQ